MNIYYSLKYFLNGFKLPTQSIVVLAFLVQMVPAWAGSYEDFFKAIQLDQPHTVQALLVRGFDPNTVAPDGVPALLKAMEEQSYKVAKVLVTDPQTQVEVRNARDESALMLAALRGQESLVFELTAKGSAVNKAGWTPLHYAATGGHVRIAAFLVGAQANVDAKSPNGTTPLMMAAMYGNAETVKFLLESGAQASIQNDLGLTAADFAARAGREASLSLIRQMLER